MKITDKIRFLTVLMMISAAVLRKEFPVENYLQSAKEKITKLYQKSKDVITGINKKTSAHQKTKKNLYKGYPSPLHPLKTITITSDFGLRGKQHTNSREFHNGIDIKAIIGTTVYSVADGMVYETGNNLSSGKYIVIIDNNRKYKFIYSHLSKILVRENEQIKQGKTIGLTGNTGKITGPHLHFGVYDMINKKYIDPKIFLQK